jgi:hypothetical protein
MGQINIVNRLFPLVDSANPIPDLYIEIRRKAGFSQS